MPKSKTVYNCSSCDYQTPKWLGCCPECNEWNTLAQQTTQPSFLGSAKTPVAQSKLTQLSKVKASSGKRMTAGIGEWDRVLGGGIMRGSFVVLTGDPGIGKSTLLLQISSSLAQEQKVLYFSSEESLDQVKLRAQRLGLA